jgi:hypothetical protein
MKIKLIRIMVCLLLIFPVFSFTAIADPSTKLEISIKGSLLLPLYSNVVGGAISNTGDATAYNISYEMTIKGGFGDTINETIQGYEYEILPNYALGIAIMYIHGFGPVIITLTASASNAETVTGTAKGYQIGGFTWVPFSWLSLFIKGNY